MIDIVNIWRKEVENLGWVFSYGNRENQNLLSAELAENQVYFLLETVTREDLTGDNGIETGYQFSGQFLLLVRSDLDNVYDNQQNTSYEGGKYTKNIQPLIESELPLFKRYLYCSEYKVTQWQVLDAINMLDMNMDGLIVTYTVEIV